MECNDLVSNSVDLQFVPANLIVQDHHVEGKSGKLSEEHPDHSEPGCATLIKFYFELEINVFLT